MQVASAADAAGQEVGGDVQTSQVLKTNSLVGDIGDQVVTASTIRFRPGERTRYHTHDYGQTLVVTEGTGMVGTEDERLEVTEGDIVFFPPDEVHWHGSAPDRDEDFEHVSIVVRDDPDEGTHAVKDLDLD
jgi:quercetin dioxygenase-like cupin family protein